MGTETVGKLPLGIKLQITIELHFHRAIYGPSTIDQSISDLIMAVLTSELLKSLINDKNNRFTLRKKR